MSIQQDADQEGTTTMLFDIAALNARGEDLPEVRNWPLGSPWCPGGAA